MSSHYKTAYNSWSGNPRGHAPDLTRCCVEVVPNERAGWAHAHQCNRKRGFGPEGAYCKQHSPESAETRRKAPEEKWAKQLRSRRFEWNGKRFYDALKLIADGHNDARGLAIDVVSKFDDGKY